MSGTAVSTPEAAGPAAVDNVVVLDNVVAGYLPGVNILNGASMTAAKGELIGIIGPNGAGEPASSAASASRVTAS